MTTDTNKTTPVAEPASEPPHRLDSWATECSEQATDKDHFSGCTICGIAISPSAGLR